MQSPLEKKLGFVDAQSLHPPTPSPTLYDVQDRYSSLLGFVDLSATPIPAIPDRPTSARMPETSSKQTLSSRIRFPRSSLKSTLLSFHAITT